MGRQGRAISAWPRSAKVSAASLTVMLIGSVLGGGGWAAREAPVGIDRVVMPGVTSVVTGGDGPAPRVATTTTGGSTGHGESGDAATVTDVVDGDTIKVSGVGAVRLIGIDTPETVHPSQPVGCFGPEASAYTASQVPPGTEVRLVYDVERQDRYGRTLAYVYRTEDGAFLNEALVIDGFAQVSTYPPNVAHVEDFIAAQREAREAGRGLWGERCSITAPDTPPTSTTTEAPIGPPPTPPATAMAPLTPPATAASIPVQSQPSASVAYPSCDAARAAGAAPVHRGDPGYGTHLDRDRDGIGCE